MKSKKIASFKKSGKYAVKVTAKKAGKTTLTATIKKGKKNKEAGLQNHGEKELT